MVRHTSQGRKQKNLGYFKTFEEACVVKDDAIAADNKPKCILE